MRILFLRPQNLIHSLAKPKNHIRTMSTKPQFLCIVHDHPGTLQKRIEVRQAHLSVVGNNQAVRAGGNPPPSASLPDSFLPVGIEVHLHRCLLLKRTYARGSNALCGTISAAVKCGEAE